MALIQDFLDFEFLPADSMGFITMKLSLADRSTLEPNHRNPLEFSPSTWPVLLLKAHYVADIAPDCYSLNLLDFTNYLKNHKDRHPLGFNYSSPPTIDYQVNLPPY